MMNVTFTKRDFIKIQRVARLNRQDSYRSSELNEYPDPDYLGSITEGAVTCDLNFHVDNFDKNDTFRISNNYAVDAQIFLLGKDNGYGNLTDLGKSINGKDAPYDNICGFYLKVADTYEKTLENLKRQFYECVAEHEELQKGLTETVLVWDKVS